jgi:peptide/nickel transport system substrate-binding protein
MRKRLFGLLAAAALVAAACGPSATQSPTGQPASPTAPPPTGASPSPSPTGPIDIEDVLYGSAYSPAAGQPGGQVVIADWQIPDQLNYYYSNALVNSEVIAITMRGLWTVTNDAKWHPDLGATVPTISDGDIRIDDAKGDCPEDAQQGDTPGFEIDLDIRPGLLWSDGEKLDLNDLKYTWEWNLDPAQTGLAAGTTGWDLIDSFDVAADGLTATVHFCTGFAGFYGLLAAPMLPEHYMSTIPIADAPERSYPVGPASVDAPVSGPFKYESVGPASIVMARNENFKAGVGGRGAPAYLDKVIFQSFDGAKDAMIAAALNGEIDVAQDLLQFDVPALQGLPSTHELLVDIAWEYEHFDFNQSGGGPGKGHPALTDENVRQALAQAIDKNGLLETVSPGIELPDEPACAPGSPSLYWHTDEGMTCPEYDPDAAKAALDAAGWTDTNGNGIRDKDGVELSLLHCTTGAPFRVAAGDFIASAFRDIGVELKNTASPETIFGGWNEVPADAECNLAHGNYDTTEFAWVYTFDLFGDYYGYHTSRIPTEENGGSGNNYVRLSNPEMDDLLDQLFGTTEPAKQAELGQAVQRLHTKLQPEVVLYYRSSARVVNTKLENFAKNPGTSTDMWNVEDWYLAP